jgi:glycosyltransferase involved in cell wall biosynthesis
MPSRTTHTLDRASTVLSPVTASETKTNEWMNRPVAYLTTTKSVGGLERHALRLAEELSKRGAHVQLICHPDSPLTLKCLELGIPQSSLIVKNSGDLAAVKTLSDYLVKNDIGILHVHSRRDFVPAVAAVKLAKIRMKQPLRLVVHVHQIRRLGEGGRWSDMFFNWGVDKVLAVSSAVRDEICRDSWLKASLVDVLINGVDEKQFELPNSSQSIMWRQSMRRRWGIDDHVPVIGMVGRLFEKGQPFVVEHIPGILNHIPRAHFVFVGPTDKGVINHFEKATKANGSYDRVILTGDIQNMPAAYAAMDVLVHLPTDEAFGLAVAEAMAASLPVIVSKVGGCVELVDHMKTGVLIEPRDGAALIAGLRGILNKPRFGNPLTLAARKSIVSDFTIDRQVDKLAAIYDEIYA